VVFANDNDGKPQTYMKLPDYYINDGIEGKGVTELSTIFAENLSTRISKQLSCSKSPLLLMTGGRDSRCIASVLSRLGYRGPAATGGAKKK